MKTIAFKAMISQNWHILLLPFLGIIFLISAIKVVNFWEFQNSDFFTFWLSGRLTSLGQNPYNEQIWIAGHHQFGATWIPNATFIYPLPISLLFIPLGLLPLYQAFIIWDILSQFMIISSIALLLKSNSNMSVKHFILPLFAGVILFRPTILTLINGQLSGMLLFLIACIIYFWEKGKWGQGAVLLAVLALKPNLGIPLIMLLSIYVVQQKQIKPLIAGIASGLLLLFAGLVQNPNWIVEFWNSGNAKLSQTFGFSPTIWGASAIFCNYSLNCTIGYGVFVGLLFLIGYLYLLVRKQKILSPELVVSLAVVITLLLTPYIWPYDQLLLVVPIVTITMKLARDGYRYLPVSLIFLEVDIFALILLGINTKIQMEISNVAIPILIFILFVWYLVKNRPVSQVIGAD